MRQRDSLHLCPPLSKKIDRLGDGFLHIGVDPLNKIFFRNADSNPFDILDQGLFVIGDLSIDGGRVIGIVPTDGIHDDGTVLDIFIGRYISRPLSTLSKEIKEVGMGDFHRLVNIKTGDEIEKLASSFNEMVKKLDEGKVENEKLQKQLFLSQKMEAIGTLTGGIAHDFNNMLNVILGYTQMVIDETKKNTTQRRYIQQIQKAGQSAAELVQQLLAFSRRQIIDPKIININEVIDNLVKMLHRIIGENIALKLSLSENVLPVMAEPGQMVQVIMNLCVNARDAMPQGGELTIETSNTTIDEAYCQVNPWAHPGSYALLSITDTGIGMDSETQMRIFEPFFTTKELGKGTGLGLAIVYGIIKQHNGLINVYSQKGHGTTFKIYVPSASGKA